MLVYFQTVMIETATVAIGPVLANAPEIRPIWDQTVVVHVRENQPLWGQLAGTLIITVPIGLGQEIAAITITTTADIFTWQNTAEEAAVGAADRLDTL